MLVFALVPALFMVLGAILYLVPTRATNLGMALFLAGAIAFAMANASHVVRIGTG